MASQHIDTLAFFTDRELDVFKLLITGLSNREIAEKLFIAEQTVKNKAIMIYQHLGVRNRTEAAYQAGLMGLLDGDRFVEFAKLTARINEMERDLATLRQDIANATTTKTT